MAALWQLSARELAARIAKGEISVSDAVEAHIARIEAVNPALNAVVWRRYEEARNEARLADEARDEGEKLGPLHGVPITIKECLDLEGSPSTFGLPSRANTVASSDLVFVSRLRKAGAIVLGKTNVSQVLLFIEADNPVYGRTNNPWDPERAPGGSSGGQAAIIAAGGSPLGLGTDIGGSNRVPAAFCGIVGMKATAGRFTDPGRFSLPAGQRAIPSQIGVFSRDVADLDLGLELIHGGRAANGDSPAPLGDFASVDLKNLRVAYFTDDGTFGAAPACRRAVTDAAKILADRGARVFEWQPPDIAEAVAMFYGIFVADGGAGLKRILGDNPRDPRIRQIEMAAAAPKWMMPLLRKLLTLSGRGKSAEILANYGRHDTDNYWQLCERLMDYQARWRRALDGAPEGPIDLILSPSAALPALRHGASLELGVLGGYACIYNVLGYPAGIVPITTVAASEESDRAASKDKMDETARETERGSAGLPVTVQVAARPWQEHVAVAAMQAIEETARSRPDYPALAKLWAR